MSRIMFCKFCGKEIPSESKFCQHCGKSVGIGNSRRNTSYKTTISMVIVMFICIAIVWIWFLSAQSVSIVGTWRNDRKVITSTIVFYDDGVYESETVFEGEKPRSDTGEWKRSGNTLVLTWWYGSVEYEICNLTSKELVLKSKEMKKPQTYCRVE